MKVFIDIYHLPQYNLFRNAIKQLGPAKVELGCVNRGKLVNIIRHECPDFTLHIFGDYKYNKGPVSMIFRIILPRIWKLFLLFRKKKYNIIGTASYQANFVAKLLGIPNFSIFDDPRLGVLQILKLVTDECFLPPFSDDYGSIKKFNALKEWAYLSPKYFSPTSSVLEEYNLKEKEYIFIREVITDTSNYLTQDENLILKLSKNISPEIKVILSLENKSLKYKYPKNWIILEEPVSDIHSLMYYSSLVISSGDSMAREGGMLGVPSVYIGNRDMPANQILIDLGTLWKLTYEETKEFINNKPTINQRDFRNRLENEWDDVTQLILNLFEKLKNN